MKVRFLFAWYDLWVGAYWDRTNRRLYVLPLPCLGIVLEFAPRELMGLGAGVAFGEDLDARSFADQVSHYADCLGWDDAKVAECVGVPAPTVRRWRNGRAVPFPAMQRGVLRLLREAWNAVSDPDDFPTVRMNRE